MTVEEIKAEMADLRQKLRFSIAFQTDDFGSREQLWMRREDLRGELERIESQQRMTLVGAFYSLLLVAPW